MTRLILAFCNRLVYLVVVHIALQMIYLCCIHVLLVVQCDMCHATVASSAEENASMILLTIFDKYHIHSVSIFWFRPAQQTFSVLLLASAAA